MKIFNKKAFLKLKEGTLFSFYEPYCIHGLCVKGKSLMEIDDFIYTNLIETVDARNSDKEIELLEGFDDIPLSCNTSMREGFFDENSKYAVYSLADLDNLREALFTTTGYDDLRNLIDIENEI